MKLFEMKSFKKMISDMFCYLLKGVFFFHHILTTGKDCVVSEILTCCDVERVMPWHPQGPT